MFHPSHLASLLYIAFAHLQLAHVSHQFSVSNFPSTFHATLAPNVDDYIKWLQRDLLDYIVKSKRGNKFSNLTKKQGYKKVVKMRYKLSQGCSHSGR